MNDIPENWPPSTRCTRGDLRATYRNLGVIAVQASFAESKAIEARERLLHLGPVQAKSSLTAAEKAFRALRETVEVARRQIANEVPNPNKLIPANP